MGSCYYDFGMSNNDEITCKYLPYYFAKQFRFYPMVNVTLESKEILGTRALVDSGATTSFIPYDVADAIGMIPKDKTKLRTADTISASGKFKSYIINLKRMQVYKSSTVFETFQDIPMYVPNEVSEPLPYAILGRDHIFSRFDITIYENRRKMTFRRHHS